jgi:hypothetical protein
MQEMMGVGKEKRKISDHRLQTIDFSAKMPQHGFQALHSTFTGDSRYKYRKINSFAIQLPFFMIKPIVSKV